MCYTYDAVPGEKNIRTAGEAQEVITPMKLHFETDNGVTIIENSFIDKYMPDANGEYVKVYLYLLRCAGSGKELSISSIADFFEHTEKDIQRALKYWEKREVLKLEFDGQDNISDIILCPDTADAGNAPAGYSGRIIPISHAVQDEPAGAEPSADAEDQASPSPTVPSRRDISPSRRKYLKDQEEIRQLFFVAETYLGRTLTAAESNNLLYFYDGLHFSADLIEYLLEHCAQRGNPGARYMEKVALSWYEKGIFTVAEAKKEAALYHRDYYLIFEALGLKGRVPAPKEIEYMKRWQEEWGFSMDIIIQACERTILQTSRPSIKYADGILKSWHEAGVRTAADISSVDASYASRKEQTRRRTAPLRTGSAGRFGNFQQREYNYEMLEQQLLAAQAAKGE